MGLLSKLNENLKDLSLMVESELHIEVKDLPDWAKRILKKHKMRPTSIGVVVDENPTVGGSWHDANRTTLYAFDGVRIEEISGTYGGVNMFASGQENTVNRGFSTKLRNMNHMVLEILSYPKMARLYVHPDAARKLLKDSGDDLSLLEKLILVATRSLKSSYGGISNYRYHESKRYYRITPDEWEKAKQSLIRKKYLNKRGAITASGRNAASRDNYGSVLDFYMKHKTLDNAPKHDKPKSMPKVKPVVAKSPDKVVGFKSPKKIDVKKALADLEKLAGK